MSLDGLLTAVLSNPEDDLPRLVYADALEETGEDFAVRKAEVIRWMVGNPKYSWWQNAQHDLPDGSPRHMIRTLYRMCSEDRMRRHDAVCEGDRAGRFIIPPHVPVYYRRGFICLAASTAIKTPRCLGPMIPLMRPHGVL